MEEGLAGALQGKFMEGRGLFSEEFQAVDEAGHRSNDLITEGEWARLHVEKLWGGAGRVENEVFYKRRPGRGEEK